MLKPDLKEAQKRSKKEVHVIYDGYQLPEEIKHLGKGKTFFLRTYGCQMNEHDSEILRAMLKDLQYEETQDYETADVLLLNTCAIRENAHNKAFGMLGRIKHLKEHRNDILVGFCGCMAQEEVVVEELLKKYQFVDFVFGTHNLHELPQLLMKCQKEKKTQVEVYSKEGDVYEGLPMDRDSNYKAWVNIMYGCNNFCTYCIVPYTRGKQRSRRKEDILEEIRTLLKDGYQEITLLGQNVNSYGIDLYENYGFANLLEDVALTNIPRIRFVTSNPWDFADTIIEVIAKYDNIMPYIHLPLQSGSDQILKQMGRRYTKDSYLTLVHKLKERIPSLALGTDIIVGFPGEGEMEFNDTLKMVKDCAFDLAYTFIYSKRTGTPASRMEDTTKESLKNVRLSILNELVNHYALENHRKLLGTVVPVLLERPSEKGDGMLMGYTDTFKLVNVKADASYLGKIVSVKITDAKTWSLDGELVSSKENL